MDLSEVFLTMLVTTVCGVAVLVIRMCFKSKCKEVSFCCLKVSRDIEAEEKEAEMIVRQPSNDNSAKL
jgi:hypothetical protein